MVLNAIDGQTTDVQQLSKETWYAVNDKPLFEHEDTKSQNRYRHMQYHKVTITHLISPQANIAVGKYHKVNIAEGKYHEVNITKLISRS